MNTSVLLGKLKFPLERKNIRLVRSVIALDDVRDVVVNSLPVDVSTNIFIFIKLRHCFIIPLYNYVFFLLGRQEFKFNSRQKKQAKLISDVRSKFIKLTAIKFFKLN